MQLDTFITESLKSIIKGIKDSQDFARENGCRVNPIRNKGTNEEKEFSVFYGKEEHSRPLTIIEFDVAVTTSTEKNTDVNAGIKVLSASLGGKKNTANISQSVSRLKFLIGASLPHELT